MKKIVISIFHGHLARNVLRTDILIRLANNKDLEVVIFAPDYKKNYYSNEFGSSNVFIESVSQIKFSKLDQFFRKLYYYFVDTETVRIIQKEQFLPNKRYFKYFITRIFTLFFSKIYLFRKFVRFLDKFLIQGDRELDLLIEKHKPDLVFATSITSDQDTMLLRLAQKRSIKTVGMVRSWDNISVNKGNVRIFPDKFVVHTEFLKQDLVSYADTNPKIVEVVGMSHFDYYINDQREQREDFLTSVGANPAKKYIYFMPIGLTEEGQDDKMIKDISDIIQSRTELSDFQLLVTLHPNTDKNLKLEVPGVIMIPPRGIISFTDGRLVDREITREAMQFMANLIYHSEMIVNYQGTSTIDAAAFDKPVININFDDTPRPYLKSVRRFYDFTHYQPIIESGGVRIAHNLDELKNFILLYTKNPQMDSEGRRKMVSEQCFKLDGRASERTVDALLVTIED